MWCFFSSKMVVTNHYKNCVCVRGKLLTQNLQQFILTILEISGKCGNLFVFALFKKIVWIVKCLKILLNFIVFVNLDKMLCFESKKNAWRILINSAKTCKIYWSYMKWVIIPGFILTIFMEFAAENCSIHIYKFLWKF